MLPDARGLRKRIFTFAPKQTDFHFRAEVVTFCGAPVREDRAIPLRAAERQRVRRRRLRPQRRRPPRRRARLPGVRHEDSPPRTRARSEEHTSELQSQSNLVCRLLLEKKKKSIR